jgi:hypothetical protein
MQVTLLQRPRTAREMVQYALAVRYARQEKYAAAAEIFTAIRAFPRAGRMKELARLHAAATGGSLPRDQQLQAQFAYGAYLADHSTRLFFNDMLWSGYQTWAFLRPGADPGLTRSEREFFLKQERRLKDDQEERWRACRILAAVAGETPRTELGRRAARKALAALQLINTGRFGREGELRKETVRLQKLLNGGIGKKVG